MWVTINVCLHTFVENEVPQRLQKNDYNALVQYLQQREFIYPEVEERITIIKRKDDGGNNDGGNGGAMTSATSSIFIVALMSLITLNFNN